MELWVPVRLDGFPAQQRDFVRQRTALSLGLNAVKVCRARWLHQPSWESFADPRGAWRGKLEWFFPALCRDRACGIREGSGASRLGGADAEVPLLSLAVSLIPLGFRWLLVEWSIPNYVIGYTAP